MKVVLTAAAAGVAVGSLVLGLTAIGGVSSASALTADAELCVTQGPVSGLTDTAAINARIVVATAEPLGGTEGAVIAVMVGYTESGLLALGNPAVTGIGLPTQGEGHDHDSVGIFQQRASWGTVAQRLDPSQSTRLFMQRLLADSQWQAEEPWTAAQDVQRSAFDGKPRAANHYSSTYGGNYAPNLAFAEAVVDRIERDPETASCGALSGGLPANQAPGSHGLPAAYVIPADATAAETKVVLFAIAQLDKPYVFGAAGPSSFDCSGLVMAAWAQVGVSLPHSAAQQSSIGESVAPDEMMPGDLVFVPGDDGTLAAPGHVGIYIGDGLVLNAADEQDGIRVQTYADFVKVGHGLSGARHVT